MFKWFFKFFTPRKIKKDNLINVQMDDGSVVPLVNSDKLELIKYSDGTAEIRLKSE